MFATYSGHWLVICYVFHILEWKDALAKVKTTFLPSEFAARVIPLHLKILLKVLVPISEVIIHTYVDDYQHSQIPTGTNVFGWLVTANGSTIK